MEICTPSKRNVQAYGGTSEIRNGETSRKGGNTEAERKMGRGSGQSHNSKQAEEARSISNDKSRGVSDLRGLFALDLRKIGLLYLEHERVRSYEEAVDLV